MDWRFFCFSFFLLVFTTLQFFYPSRRIKTNWPKRWLHHLSLGAFGGIVALPFSAISAAYLSHVNSWGLLPWLPLPFWLTVFLSVLLLDFVIYWQHRWFHNIDSLWRLHRVHHSDQDFETSTAIRFHPLEIALSMMIKVSVIIIFGIPVIAVLIFEIILNGCALFNHSNFSLPQPIEQHVRKIFVTPDMHRIHHSIDHREMNTNFGFCLSWWDFLCRTYTEKPTQHPQEFPLGVRNLATPTTLIDLLRQPWMNTTSTESHTEPKLSEQSQKLP